MVARRDADPHPVIERARLVAVLGHDPADDRLVSQACNHRSWCAENPGDESNERLEFLGDSVLGFVVADLVYRRCPDLDEGSLTDIRKAVVNTVCLAEVASDAGLGVHLRLGNGEEQSGGREKQSILADFVEALLGAVYLEAGIDAVTAVVLEMLGSRIDAAIADGGRNLDHKSRLQERLAADGSASPAYRVDAAGPDHAREFTAAVSVGDRVLGTGSGRSKKQAEQQAARHALAALGVADPSSPIPPPDAGGADNA